MRVGVIGGGQLGRLLALAGRPLGIETVHLDPAPDACAGQVAPLLVGAYDDPRLIAELCRGADAVTVDLEQVPLGALARVPSDVPVWPPPQAVATAQDRLLEKRLFQELGIDTPLFAPVDGPEDLAAAARLVGFPLLLKTRFGGYDGRGQQRVDDAAGLEPAWRALDGQPLVAEQLVAFDREVSSIVVREAGGSAVSYPLVENVHAEGILRECRVPATATPATADSARTAALRIAERLGHVGVLALELFVLGDRLVANEIAPRVHNSGHWTIEGAETSQFENHLRAVCGLPLGSAELLRPSATVNLIGVLPDRAAVLSVRGTHLHAYGKALRPGRKVGHITVTARDVDELEQRIAALRRALRPTA